MEEQSICLCAPLLAEADTENDINSIPKVSSVSDADTVINTNNTNSSQTEGDQGEGELLEELLTDDYCRVCEAVLLFESQRVSHYEGKKHAQKLRLYLQAKRDEKRSKDASGLQRSMTMDKERFCELCSMVFSSPVVARSHYEGKVHAKNLRKQHKQGLYPTTLPTGASSQNGPRVTLSAPTPISVTSDTKSSEEGNKWSQDPSVSTDTDLSDPNRHCRLCAASFNNPQMALQHYNGRKHQRNQSRQQLLKELGDDHVQANCFTCPMCNIELNSVEMYQAHMQGNKHQIKEKKVVDLCKSQKKVYNSFTDELADYIQVQKARGLAPKTNIGLNEGDEQNEGKEEEEEEEDVGSNPMGGGLELNTKLPNLPPSSNPPLPPHAASFYPPAGWCPPYQAPPTPFGFGGNTLAWVHAYPHLPPQPLLPGLGSPRLIGRPPARRRARECSSSSSYTSSSSSYTSSSSSSSDSSDSDYRHRERKRKRGKSRRERGRRVREEDSDKEEMRRRRHQGRGVRDNSEGRKGREDDAEVEGDGRRTSRKRASKSNRHGERHRAKRRHEEDGEEEDKAKKSAKEDIVDDGVGRGEEELRMQSEKKEDSEEWEQAQPSKPKHRKDKKKTKEKVDTRTEEEKLWDESILGL